MDYFNVTNFTETEILESLNLTKNELIKMLEDGDLTILYPNIKNILDKFHYYQLKDKYLKGLKTNIVMKMYDNFENRRCLDKLGFYKDYIFENTCLAKIENNLENNDVDSEVLVGDKNISQLTVKLNSVNKIMNSSLKSEGIIYETDESEYNKNEEKSNHNKICNWHECVKNNHLMCFKYHLEMLKNNKELFCEFADFGIKSAGRYGHHEIIEYLYFDCEVSIETLELIMIRACRYGYLKVIEFLIFVNPQLIQETMFHEAGAYCQIDIMKCLHNAKVEYSKDMNNYANGRKVYLEVIKLLHSFGVQYTNVFIETLYKQEQYDIIKYLYSVGVQFENNEVNMAVQDKNIDIAKFLIDAGAKYTSYAMSLTCAGSEMSGKRYFISGMININTINCSHLESAKYLYSVGTRCIDNEINWPLTNDNLEIAKFLYENGTTISEYTMKSTCMSDDIKSIIWLKNIGTNMCSKSTCMNRNMASGILFQSVTNYIGVQNKIDDIPIFKVCQKLTDAHGNINSNLSDDEITDIKEEWALGVKNNIRIGENVTESTNHFLLQTSNLTQGELLNLYSKNQIDCLEDCIDDCIKSDNKYVLSIFNTCAQM